MSIKIEKRKTAPLNVFLKTTGQKLNYTTNPQKDIKISIQSNKNEANEANKKETTQISNPNPSPAKNVHQPPPISKSQIKQPKQFSQPDSRFTLNTSNQRRNEHSHEIKPNANFSKNSINEEIEQTDEHNEKQNSQEEDKKFKIPDKPENIEQQKSYIKSAQELINIINLKPQEEIIREIQINFEALKEMLHTLVTFDDSLLNTSNIFISYINLFLKNSDTERINRLYSIFIDNGMLLIGQKLLYYFDSYSEETEVVVEFLRQLASIQFSYISISLNFFQSIIDSKKSTLSETMIENINKEIERLENEIIFQTDKKQLEFNEKSIFQKLDDSELTNMYEKLWPSLEQYVKVMFNLTFENFFIHLEFISKN